VKAPSPPPRPYAFGVTLTLPYAQAVAGIRTALRRHGFGVLTAIDVTALLNEGLGADFRPYVILYACNPTLAHRALRADLGVGLLLPCAVIVYATGDGASVVAVLDPEVALAAVGDNTALAIVACEAKARLRRALDNLGASSEEGT
jgi:uncharacterized protein (DUF302 family)